MCKLRRRRRARNVAPMGEMRNAYKSLVGKPERKRQLGRHRRKWEEYTVLKWLEGVD
jgi:hypothetical protein